MYSPIKPAFTISATATDGRNGHTETEDHLVKADLSLAKGLGGAGATGKATPEHLFAAGYAACFCGAVEFIQHQHKQDQAKPKVTCAVTVGPREAGGLGLTVKMTVENKAIPQADFEKMVHEAHEKVCPYSHATRDNVPVTFEILGG
jgi:lipoyl-dependent peroxiredoxin